MKVPHPAGVPVLSTSPGERVITELSHSMATSGGLSWSATSSLWRSRHSRTTPGDPCDVRQFVSRDDARAHRAEGVEVLAQVALSEVEPRLEPASLMIV
jgi:hypothetical protein